MEKPPENDKGLFQRILKQPQKQKMGAKRPSNFLVLFTDRMVTNCPMKLGLL
jgi:hypothetical protein